MPLFMMISGYLFYHTRVSKNWKYKDMLKDKWLRLGIPYLFIITIALLIKIVYPSQHPQEISIFGIIRNYTHPFDGAMREMWFVAAILLYFLLYPLYRPILQNKYLSIVGLIIAVIMFFIPYLNVTRFLAINKGIHLFVYFYLGLLMASRHLEKYLSSYIGLAIILILLVVSQDHKSLFMDLINSIAGCWLLWGLALLTDRYLTSNLFRSFRNYTYQIFLIGIFGQVIVKMFYQKFPVTGTYLLWWLVCIIVGIYLPVVISNLLKQYKGPGAGVLRRCIGLKN